MISWSAAAVVLSVFLATFSGIWVGVRLLVKFGILIQRLETIVEEQSAIKRKVEEQSTRIGGAIERLSRIEGKLNGGI